jgi:thiol-disulfide isomerase/thioredoxin
MDSFQKYQKYKTKYLSLKKMSLKQNGGSDLVEKTDSAINEKPEFYLFKAEWCGHCQAFIKDWNILSNDDKLKKKINFTTIDSDLHKDEIKKWEITGFPTLILRIGDKAIEYSAKRTIPDITNFIKENTGKIKII